MSPEKSKITISFHPPAEGSGCITLHTLLDNSQFHCDEIVADFSTRNVSVSLSGFFDSGARVRGVLKSDTASRISILKFLNNELSKKIEVSKHDSVKNARILISQELESVQSGLKDAQNAVEEILRIQAEDFEWSREVVTKSLYQYFKRKKKNLSYELPYSSISSFLSIGEKENKISIEEEVRKDASFFERCTFIEGSLTFDLEGDTPVLTCAYIPAIASSQREIIGFFRIKSGATDWIDYEAQICKIGDQHVLKLPLDSFSSGTYTCTTYLESYYTRERVWYNAPGQDYVFNLNTKSKPSKRWIPTHKAVSSIELDSYVSFSRWCMRNISKQEFGRTFFHMLSALDTESQKSIFEYYTEAIKECSRKVTKRGAAVIKAFRVIGVSEVLMVTPEGPHAMAGGLSQVIIGLSSALASEECSVTIVSPLYFDKNGHHHESLESVRENGLTLNGIRHIPTYVDTIYVKDSFYNNTPQLRSAEVYQVQHEKIRLLLISNKELCDRLYGGISGIDRLQRSSFLCRVTHEIIKNKNCACNPDIIMTHDWTTALFPLFREISETSAPIVHVLHNAGTAYQGRFSTIENGSDVYAALSLPEEKRALLLEEGGLMLNCTRATCIDNPGALVTVSKPYAQQLISENDASEVGICLRSKKGTLYGISNGIPTQVVQEAAFGVIQAESTMTYSEILQMKQAIRDEISSQYQLSLRSDDLLAVLVGRLTDQKGVSLLTDIYKNEQSVLESILEDCPRLTIVIAGPPSEADESCASLLQLVSRTLSEHPRFRSRFEFLPHTEAIRLTAAADLFLMPSRYEPGGIAQLEALAVGTSVVAHRVGGLSATLQQYQKQGNAFSGNSFLFEDFDAAAFYDALLYAYHVMSHDIDRAHIVSSAYYSKNDWKDRVPYYLSLFQSLVGVFDQDMFTVARLTDNRRELLSKISVKS